MINLFLIFLLTSAQGFPWPLAGEDGLDVQIHRQADHSQNKNSIAIINIGTGWRETHQQIKPYSFDKQAEGSDVINNRPRLPSNWIPLWVKETHPYLSMSSSRKNIEKISTKKRANVENNQEGFETKKSTVPVKQPLTEGIVQNAKNVSEKPITVDFENTQTSTKKFVKAHGTEVSESIDNSNQLTNKLSNTVTQPSTANTTTPSQEYPATEAIPTATYQQTKMYPPATNDTVITVLSETTAIYETTIKTEDNETIGKLSGVTENHVNLASTESTTQLFSPKEGMAENFTETTISTETSVATTEPGEQASSEWTLQANTSSKKPSLLNNTILKQPSTEITTEKALQFEKTAGKKKAVQTVAIALDIKKFNDSLMESNYMEKTVTEATNEASTATDVIAVLSASSSQPPTTEEPTKFVNSTEIDLVTRPPVTEPGTEIEKSMKSTAENFTANRKTTENSALGSLEKNESGQVVNSNAYTGVTTSKTTSSPEDLPLVTTSPQLATSKLPNDNALKTSTSNNTGERNFSKHEGKSATTGTSRNIAQFVTKPTERSSSPSNPSNVIENITERAQATDEIGKNANKSLEDNKASEAEKSHKTEKVIVERVNAFDNFDAEFSKTDIPNLSTTNTIWFSGERGKNETTTGAAKAINVTLTTLTEGGQSRLQSSVKADPSSTTPTTILGNTTEGSSEYYYEYEYVET